MRCAASLSLVLAASVLLLGCPKKPSVPTFSGPEEFDRPLPPGELGLRKITDPRDMPEILPACESTFGLREAIAASLSYMSKASSRRFFPYGQITHEQAVASLRAMDGLLAANRPAQELRKEILDRFDVYTSVGWNGRGEVLFTGYYTPIFDGSLAPTDRFRWPLYKPPPGLVKDADGEVLGIRGADGSLSKLPARRELEGMGMLKGLELVWLADPFEAYIAHVQGSAKIRTPDGRILTVGYAATNGHEYHSVAQEMIRDGKIDAASLSLQSMIAYFKANPGEVQEYVNRNPRYVFFEMSDGPPRGCLNEPITPMRTVATDKQVYPRGCLGMVVVDLPRRLTTGVEVIPCTAFVLDQDRGGAIRAPGRCDIYVGMGEPAGELAGRTYSRGRLYYLFLKPSSVPAPVLEPSASLPTQPTTSIP